MAEAWVVKVAGDETEWVTTEPFSEQAALAGFYGDDSNGWLSVRSRRSKKKAFVRISAITVCWTDE